MTTSTKIAVALGFLLMGVVSMAAGIYLRANRNVVFGLSITSTPLNSSSTVGSTCAQIVAANSQRSKVRIVNSSGTNIFVLEGTTSTGMNANTGILLNANGGALEVIPNPVDSRIWTKGYFACTASGTSTVTINEEYQ